MLGLRLTSIATGLIFVFASAATAQRSRQDLEPRDGACFYEDMNFAGSSFCVSAGETLEAVPRGMNDRVSSIRTFGRSEVTVYRDESFGGGSARFDSDVPDLREASWNDRISSVQVRSNSYGYRGGSDRSARGASRIVRRAYRDVLGREPDTEGLQYYRGRILDEGWTEAQVRRDLRRSNEYKTQASDDTSASGGMTRSRAENIVRRAYRSVLNREPDPASEGYVEHVLRDGWSQLDVERDLRRSAEYRNR